MATYRENPDVRALLTDRRGRLVTAVSAPDAPRELSRLLADVDAALDRFDQGRFGLCETCGDAIEDDRLRADPLIRFCLDHLDTVERAALERDLAMAAEVQRTLLPKPHLRVAGWEACFVWEPHGLVSGDYCDLVTSRDPADGLLFAVGDVAGKGIAASLLATHLNALFRSLGDLGLAVPEMLQRANRLFCEGIASSQYATLVVGRARPDGTVELGNAAQTPPLLVRGHEAAPTRATGLPLGMFCDSPYLPESVRLNAGDMLVICTDGVTEAHDARGEEFGLDRVAWAAAGAASALEAVEAVASAVATFRGGVPRADDLTALVLRRAG